MTQLDFHNNFSFKPPPRPLPIIQRLVSVYKLWLEFQNNIPKKLRHTLGEKIVSCFLNTIELLLIATYLGKEQKSPYLQKAGNKLDILKFFLQIAWEIKAIDNKKYILLSEQLNEIGKMIGGWNKGLQKQNPAQGGE